MHKLRHLISTLFLIAALILIPCACAQTNLTQIRDTIYNADGTPFNGTVVITWNGSSSTLSGTVSPLSTSARIYNGALSVLLVPTTTAGGNSYYQVVYTSSDGTTQWTETWQVPPSSNALSVSGVRTSSTTGGTSTGTTSTTGGTGTGTTQYATLPISMSQVTGLTSSLSTLSSSVSTNSTAVSSLQSSVTGLQTSYGTLNTTVSGLQTSFGTLNTTVGGLQTSYGTLNTMVTGLQSSLGTMNSSLSGVQSSYSTLNSTVSGLQTSLNSTNATVTSLQTGLANLNTTVSGLSTSSGSAPFAFEDGDVPAGATNGSNMAFTLSATPSPATSLSLYRNGLLQKPGIDFTLSGAAITFTSPAVPKTGDSLQAFYRISGTTTPLPAFADGEIPGGTVNGTNATFTLAAGPSPAKSLELFKNGMLLCQGIDYTVSGATITFMNAAVPQSGDSLEASYRH